MPTADVITVVMDRGIGAAAQDLSEAACKRDQMRSTIAQIVDRRAECFSFPVVVTGHTAGGEEIEARDVGFLPMPEPKQFHQPGLGATHSEIV